MTAMAIVIWVPQDWVKTLYTVKKSNNNKKKKETKVKSLKFWIVLFLTNNFIPQSNLLTPQNNVCQLRTE